MSNVDPINSIKKTNNFGHALAKERQSLIHKVHLLYGEDSSNIPVEIINAEEGISSGILNIARTETSYRALNQVGSVLDLMQDFTMQANNSVGNGEMRSLLNDEVLSLVDWIKEFGSQTRFNQQPILQGDKVSVTIVNDISYNDPNIGGIIDILETIDASSPGKARKAMETIEIARDMLIEEQAKVGANNAMLMEEVDNARRKVTNFFTSSSEIINNDDLATNIAEELIRNDELSLSIAALRKYDEFIQMRHDALLSPTEK